VNRKRQAGFSLLRAVSYAGVKRFRPILLTSMTTVAGLTPLLLEKSRQAQFLIPMAVSLAGGIAFATLLTLYLVPMIYLIFEDIGRMARRYWAWQLGRPQPQFAVGTQLGRRRGGVPVAHRQQQ
jgi:Cu/Ag efflux pump CusA